MSTINVSNLKNASAASPAIVLAADGSATANLSSVNGGPIAGSRNRIINGDMRIDQRNAGASVTPTAWAYTVDRWGTEISQASKFSIQQNAGSITPPNGFTNYVGVTSLSSYTTVAGDYFELNQQIEGFNAADLGWGTASAQSITLSFWVRSSLTGTHSGVFRNGGNTRSYPFTFTISSANTWEYKSVVVAGDTTGTWLATNGSGIQVGFSLGGGTTFRGTAGAWAGADYRAGATGSVNIVGTNGATFYITGVQLEPGSTATPFERRSYGQELALCQRYFCKTFQQSTAPAQAAALAGCLSVGGFNAQPVTLCSVTWRYPTTMRGTPTVTSYAPIISGSGFKDQGGSLVSATIDFIGDYQLTVYNTNILGGNVRLDIHLAASAEL